MSDYVQVPTRSLDYLERAISNVNANVVHVANRVDGLENHLRQVDQQLAQLRRSFQQMIEEQRQQAAFQRAITEVIRVRQEVEQKFGTHKLVRDTLLGILQATDAALITDATISRCSEELMLTVPEYWLAPCLVAIAAWIAGRDKPESGKEKALAVRAIHEALKRSVDKTCLLFALICRRNKKRKACFEWLSRYFETQDATKTTKSVVAIIDAYSNGVFGIDEDGICEHYIANWMGEIRQKNPVFDEEQKAYWKNFFNVQGATVAYRSENYAVLKEVSKDFDRINNFVSRITAFNNPGGVRDQLEAKSKAEVDIEKLRKDVDEQLKRLVTNYEEGEEARLRDEEELLEKIKTYRGDEKRANREMELIKSARLDPPVDFVSRLRSAVADRNADISTQKTAIFLLKNYIIDAYKEYITENKEAYPEVINLALKESVTAGASKTVTKPINWKGTTASGENVAELTKEITKIYETAKEQSIEAVTPSKAVKIISMILFYIPWIFVKKKFEENKAAIERTYNSRCKASITKLNKALSARADTHKMVTEFCAKDGWDEFKLDIADNSNVAAVEAEVANTEVVEEVE